MRISNPAAASTNSVSLATQVTTQPGQKLRLDNAPAQFEATAKPSDSSTSIAISKPVQDLEMTLPTDSDTHSEIMNELVEKRRTTFAPKLKR